MASKRWRTLQRPREERDVAPCGVTEVEALWFAALSLCFFFLLHLCEGKGASALMGQRSKFGVGKGGQTRGGRGTLKLKSSLRRIVVKQASSTLNFRTDPQVTLTLSFHLSQLLRKSMWSGCIVISIYLCLVPCMQLLWRTVGFLG